MKSLAKLNLIVLLVLSLFFFLFEACSENSPSEPEEENVEVLASEIIGSEGGTIEIEDLQIVIPTGAFSENLEINLTTSNFDNNFNQDAHSEFFSLEGLPSTFSKPIKIRLKYEGTLSNNSFIAIGEENYVKSMNGNCYSYKLQECKDSSGYLITTLETTETGSLAKLSNSSEIMEDKISLNIGAISGYASYTSSQNHFIIHFPSAYLTEAYDLADYLENAYVQFSNMGFQLSRRTKWPVEVTIKKLESSVFGYSYNSVWGDNYGYMEFNADKLGDKENLKVTAGHEFFHLVQSLYDPRNRFSKAKLQAAHLWLDEAASVWSESLFSNSGLSYTSPIFSDNAYEILKGAKTPSTNSEAQSYGYGFASLIKYIVNKYSSSALVKIYDEIYAGKSPFIALSSVFPYGIDFAWSDYLKNLFSFQLYEGETFRTATLLSTAKIKQNNFVIKSTADSVKTYKSNLSDLSGTIFSVSNQYDKLNDNAQLNVICKDWKFHVFKVDGNSSVLLGSKKDTLKVYDFKKIIDDGYQIGVVLYNDNMSYPYTNEAEYELQMKVLTPKTIKNVYISVSYTGNFAYTTINNYNGSSETTYSAFETGMSSVVWKKDQNIESDSFVMYQDSTDDYYNYKTTIGLTVDDIENITEIKGFTFDKITKNISVDVTTTESAAGNNISFTKSDYGSVGSKFYFEGDISQVLSKLTHYEKLIQYNNSGEIITELISYEPTGKIMILIDYE